MKIMVASDIHGSASCCEKLLAAMEKEDPDRLLLLGDLLYHGPRNDLPDEYSTKKTAALLNSVKDKLICIRGNCDAEVDQMMLDFPITAEYCILSVGGRSIFASHGHRYNIDYPPQLCNLDILLCGHTHVPACEKFGDGNLYLNPGSVSIPKQKSRNSYMIISEGLAEWKDLDMNIYHSGVI